MPYNLPGDVWQYQYIQGSKKFCSKATNVISNLVFYTFDLRTDFQRTSISIYLNGQSQNCLSLCWWLISTCGFTEGTVQSMTPMIRHPQRGSRTEVGGWQADESCALRRVCHRYQCGHLLSAQFDLRNSEKPSVVMTKSMWKRKSFKTIFWTNSMPGRQELYLLCFCLLILKMRNHTQEKNQT